LGNALGGVLGVSLALGLAFACGNDKANNPDAGATGGATGGAGGTGTGGSTGAKVVISGVAAPFPGDPETDFTQLSLSIADPVSVLTGQAPLAMAASFDTSAATCPGACVAPYSFSDVMVDPTVNTLGLLAILDDVRPTPAGGGLPAKWIRTGTGIANQAQVAAAVASGMLANRPAYAVSAAFEGKLAQFVSAAGGTTNGVTGAAGSLASRGFILTMILANADPRPTPVEGATFGPKDPTVSSKYAVIYPNADFSGVGAATSATGLVLVYPVAGPPATPPVGYWVVTPPAGNTTTWPEQVVGAQANGAVVLLDVSN
jgi:hypothetical protein